LPRFDGRSPFTTWAYRVAMNASFDELRRRARRPLVSLDALPDDTAGAPVGGVEEVAERLDVDGALRQLPEDFRAPVVLRDLCGLDYLEISDVLGVPLGTVKSRIARGRAALVPLLRAGGERSEA
jgi:RNA polymerase sigma-70 factor (ECF subfamily)